MVFGDAQFNQQRSTNRSLREQRMSDAGSVVNYLAQPASCFEPFQGRIVLDRSQDLNRAGRISQKLRETINQPLNNLIIRKVSLRCIHTVLWDIKILGSSAHLT